VIRYGYDLVLALLLGTLLGLLFATYAAAFTP
jgi:hypothetical protein